MKYRCVCVQVWCGDANQNLWATQILKKLNMSTNKDIHQAVSKQRWCSRRESCCGFKCFWMKAWVSLCLRGVWICQLMLQFIALHQLAVAPPKLSSSSLLLYVNECNYGQSHMLLCKWFTVHQNQCIYFHTTWKFCFCAYKYKKKIGHWVYILP